MLSESKQLNGFSSELPRLDEPLTVRVKFRKVGDLQYISHLDLQRTLHRILVRARIPMWYTQGFNPHPKIVFSTPLSIGAESECEMVDIRIDRDISCQEIKERLNKQVTSDLAVLDVYYPTVKFSELKWAEYEITAYDPCMDPACADRIISLLQKDELPALKKTKSGEKQVNIRPWIHSLDCLFNNEDHLLTIHTILNVSGENYLNPELLFSVLDERCKVLTSAENIVNHTIMRQRMYSECEGKLVEFH